MSIQGVMTGEKNSTIPAKMSPEQCSILSNVVGKYVGVES